METSDVAPLEELFFVPRLGLSLYMDRQAGLFWKLRDGAFRPLSEMPWKLQQPFYLIFLHDDVLSERFKNMEIIGAIDLYIKARHVLGRPLGI